MVVGVGQQQFQKACLKCKVRVRVRVRVRIGIRVTVRNMSGLGSGLGKACLECEVAPLTPLYPPLYDRCPDPVHVLVLLTIPHSRLLIIVPPHHTASSSQN